MLEEQKDAPEAVAARLKRLREIFGLNRKQMAESLGVAEQNYGQIEKAQRNLPLTVAKALREKRQISLEFIYFGKIDDLPTRISREL